MKAKKAKVTKELKEGVAGDVFDSVMDVVCTTQMGWNSTPKSMQETIENKIRDAVNSSVANALRLLVMQDFPAIVADLESVKTKKGKTVVTLTIAAPDVNGYLSQLNYKTRQGGEVVILFADPKDYVDGGGKSRAEDDQKPLFKDDGKDDEDEEEGSD